MGRSSFLGSTAALMRACTMLLFFTVWIRLAGAASVVSIWYGYYDEYNNLEGCAQNCIATGDVREALDCDGAYENACYCNTDKFSVATSAISTCVTKNCNNVVGADITSAIKAYTDYCSTAFADEYIASATTTTTAGGAAGPGTAAANTFTTATTGAAPASQPTNTANPGNGGNGGTGGNGCNGNSGTCTIQQGGASCGPTFRVLDAAFPALFALGLCLVLSAVNW